MTNAAKPTGRPRTALLSVVMLGILCLSVAIAYLLTQSRDRYNTQGTRIMQEIRLSGLPALWKGPSDQYFLVSTENQTIGFAASSRMPAGSGFQGFGLQMTHDGRAWSGSFYRWNLDAGATHGDYTAGDVELAGSGLAMVNRWRIRISEQTVTLTQFHGPLAVQSPTKAPDNFLPNGCKDLAVQMVAREKTQAYFRNIAFERMLVPSEGKVPEPSTALINIKYRGSRQLEGRECAEVSYERGGLGMESRETCYVDSSGRTVQIVRGAPLNQQLRAVSLKQLAEPFNHEAPQIIKLIKRNMRLPAAEGD